MNQQLCGKLISLPDDVLPGADRAVGVHNQVTKLVGGRKPLPVARVGAIDTDKGIAVFGDSSALSIRSEPIRPFVQKFAVINSIQLLTGPDKCRIA